MSHAVPPLAAALALAVGLGVLKRLAMSQTAPTVARASEPSAAPAVAGPVRRRGSEPVGFTRAVDAYRASVDAGRPVSQRELAQDFLDGNRHAAKRAIAASMNGAVT